MWQSAGWRKHGCCAVYLVVDVCKRGARGIFGTGLMCHVGVKRAVEADECLAGFEGVVDVYDAHVAVDT